MKTSKKEIIKRDKILGNPKICKRWLVWFRTEIDECCGTNAWYPINGRISISTIDIELKSSNAYKYRPENAIGYRIWAGSILNGNYITELKKID